VARASSGARPARPGYGTLTRNLAAARPCPLRSVPYTPPGEDSLWGPPIRDTVSARISPAQNVLFWCSIGHYSYDKIADHSGGSVRARIRSLFTLCNESRLGP